MIRFKKMHGNGNDFIVIENLTKANSLSKSQIVKIGARKKGLGFDQLITINPPKKSDHDFYVKFFNSNCRKEIVYNTSILSDLRYRDSYSFKACCFNPRF